MSWQAVVERTVTGLGYDLVDTERTPGGLLRVYLDKRPGDAQGAFITVDDCELVTRQLQHVLEVENCPYERLEVSSPGLDRPLKKAADYARFTGEVVELTLKLPLKGRKKFRGQLLAASAPEGGWRLLLNDAAADAKPGAAEVGEADPVLDFQLQDVRAARLVPVLDFKGLRFLPAAPAAPAAAGRAEACVDGGLKQ